jgi:glucose/arabinose dehydrogenase
VQLSNPLKILFFPVVVLAAICMNISLAPAHNQSNPAAGSNSQACPNDDSGLKLPSGFCATVFADEIGHVRHMVVAPSGVLYVNTWSGKYYGNDTPHSGGFLVALQDKSGTGKADVIERFGETVQSGGAGGTGIGMYKGSIYAEINDRIVRYSLSSGSIVPSGSADTIISGLPLGGDHPMHPFIIDAEGLMYVDVATATNSCQLKNRHSSRPARTHARNLRPVVASGAMTQIRATKLFRRLSASLRESATLKVLPSTQAGACLWPNTDGTSCARIGLTCINPTRRRRCRLRSCCF